MHEGGVDRKRGKKAARGLLAGFVVMGLIAACTGGEGESSLTASDARRLCDEAIRTASLNAAQVEIPDKAARETVKVFSFIWRLGDGLKMPDQSGAQSDAAVTCRVSKEGREVVYLEINSERVLSR